jgi:beta-lactamase class D
MNLKMLTYILLTLLAHSNIATADKIDCIIVKKGDKILLQEGKDCNTQYSPNSTFKIPLAIMGFESGILKGRHSPVWKPQKPVTFLQYYHDGEQSPFSWMTFSMPWYSQILTHKIGIQKFQEYVNHMNYGNMDLSGDIHSHNFIEGKIVPGKGEARKLNCPTINIKVDDIKLKEGLHLCNAYIDHATHNAICYYDLSRPGIIETHILNKNINAEDIDNLKIEILKFMRDKIAFTSVDEIKIQIEKDLNTANQEFPKLKNGITDSWLSSSLKITPMQQIEFIEKLAKNELLLSQDSQIKAKDLMKFFEADSNGWNLHGKSGSSDFDKTNMREGYYVGFAEKNGEIISFVIHMSGKFGDKKANTGGIKAKKILIERMIKENLLP